MALLLAVASLLSNITTTDQLSGRANGVLVIRSYISKLVNAGSIWAALSVYAGWVLRRPLSAIVGAVGTSLLALAAHYGVGQVIGIYDADIWVANREWFVVAILFGIPLALVGVLTRRPGFWGLLAGLVVPVGMCLEPWVTGLFTQPSIIPWPQRYSSIACAITLIAGGLCLGTRVVLNRVGTASSP